MNQAAWRIAQRFKISVVDAVKLQAAGLRNPRDIYEADDEALEKAAGGNVLAVLRKQKPHEKKPEKQEG